MSALGTSCTVSLGKAGAVSIRRTVNDEIARIGATFQADNPTAFEFVCECGELRCAQVVSLSLADYAETTPGSVVGHDA
jgi:hypothetical protein